MANVNYKYDKLENQLNELEDNIKQFQIQTKKDSFGNNINNLTDLDVSLSNGLNYFFYVDDNRKYACYLKISISKKDNSGMLLFYNFDNIKFDINVFIINHIDDNFIKNNVKKFNKNFQKQKTNIDSIKKLKDFLNKHYINNFFYKIEKKIKNQNIVIINNYIKKYAEIYGIDLTTPHKYDFFINRVQKNMENKEKKKTIIFLIVVH